MMREVTVQEFVNAVKDVNIYDFEVMTGMKIDMSKARVEYDASDKELIIVAGNHVTDGLGSIRISEALIESIDFDEEEQVYVVSLINGTDFTVWNSPIVSAEELEKAVYFMIPDSVDSENREAVSSYMKSIKHYFVHDNDGNRIGFNVKEFCIEAEKAGLMEVDANGSYKVTEQKNVSDFVERLNLSEAVVRAMFAEMSK